MTTVLVTGASGFVGRHVMDAFRTAGVEALGLARRSAHDGVDLLDQPAIRGAVRDCHPAVILHLAGTIDRRSAATPRLYSDNIRATAGLLEAVRAEAPDATVLLASSSAVYGAASPRVVSENEPLRPVSAYGLSKAAAEELGRAYRRTGVDVRILRLFNLLGPGMPAGLVLSDAAAQLASGLPLRLGPLGAGRDFTDVRDIAALLTRLSIERPEFEVVNCGSGTSRSIAECVAILTELSGAEWLSTATAAVEAGEIADQVADCDLLRAIVPGWRPVWSLRTSLNSVLDDWRERVDAVVHCET